MVEDIEPPLKQGHWDGSAYEGEQRACTQSRSLERQRIVAFLRVNGALGVVALANFVEQGEHWKG